MIRPQRFTSHSEEKKLKSTRRLFSLESRDHDYVMARSVSSDGGLRICETNAISSYSENPLLELCHDVKKKEQDEHARPEDKNADRWVKSGKIVRQLVPAIILWTAKLCRTLQQDHGAKGPVGRPMDGGIVRRIVQWSAVLLLGMVYFHGFAQYDCEPVGRPMDCEIIRRTVELSGG